MDEQYINRPTGKIDLNKNHLSLHTQTGHSTSEGDLLQSIDQNNNSPSTRPRADHGELSSHSFRPINQIKDRTGHINSPASNTERHMSTNQNASDQELCERFATQSSVHEDGELESRVRSIPRIAAATTSEKRTLPETDPHTPHNVQNRSKRPKNDKSFLTHTQPLSKDDMIRLPAALSADDAIVIIPFDDKSKDPDFIPTSTAMPTTARTPSKRIEERRRRTVDLTSDEGHSTTKPSKVIVQLRQMENASSNASGHLKTSLTQSVAETSTTDLSEAQSAAVPVDKAPRTSLVDIPAASGNMISAESPDQSYHNTDMQQSGSIVTDFLRDMIAGHERNLGRVEGDVLRYRMDVAEFKVAMSNLQAQLEQTGSASDSDLTVQPQIRALNHDILRLQQKVNELEQEAVKKQAEALGYEKCMKALHQSLTRGSSA